MSSIASSEVPHQGVPNDLGRAALAITGLSKHYPGTHALDDVSMEVSPGTVHALLGGNGSGKSTLIKILAGVVPADQGGEVTANGVCAVAEHIDPFWSQEHGLRFVHQDLGLFANLTVAENLFAGQSFPRRSVYLDWKRAMRAAGELLARHHIDVRPNSAMSELRPAEQTLVAIARAVDDVDGSKRKILVLDEPTARLPAPDAKKLLEAMRRYADAGHAVIFVSHHLDEVLDVADVATVLRDGQVVATRQIVDLDAMSLTELISGETPKSSTKTRERKESRTILRVRGLVGDRQPHFDLTVREGEVVGIAGLTGSGRTNLLELLFGARQRRTGIVEVDGHALPAGNVAVAVGHGVGYVPEDRTANAGLMGLSLVDNITAATLRRYRTARGLDTKKELRAGVSAIERLGVKSASPMTALDSLSGGNQQKIIVARWFEIQPRVLLLDEPTQGVDVGARAEIHRLVLEATAQGSCAVLVSADTEELLTLSDRILILQHGRITDERDRGSASRTWLDEHFYRASHTRSTS